jgi:hypothetical protein
MNKEFEQFKAEIANLGPKKKCRINLNGNKVKVACDSEDSFSIYHDGHYIDTLKSLEDIYITAYALLEFDQEA